MRIKLELTEDHIKLIPFFYLQENEDENGIEIKSDHLYCLGSHLLEDMSKILGFEDKKIPQSINDAEGAAFEDDAEEYMLQVHSYMKDNLKYIESLLHQRALVGIQPGTYEAQSHELIWSKIN